VIATFLHKYLPGEPAIVVQNMPGANGIVSVNYLVRRTQPDGLTLAMGSEANIDPMVYRTSPNVQYDPKSLRIVGGVGRGGSIIFAAAGAVPRLYDKSQAPLVIGSPDAMPRAAMQPVLWGIEYLGWNAKWVTGYAGTNEVMLAFDRGEVDMTSTGNIFQIQDRLNGGRLTILTQTGTIENGRIVGRAQFGNAPIFSEQMAGKITDPTAQKAFAYWGALNASDKWLGLPPDTPDAILAAYREAFRNASDDKEFLDMGGKISDGFTPISGPDFEGLVNTLVDTTPEALDYAKGLMRKQGLKVP
jgi:hypothetical protein